MNKDNQLEAIKTVVETSVESILMEQFKSHGADTNNKKIKKKHKK